jgi:NADH dehydrogenase
MLESTDRIIHDLPEKHSLYVMRYFQSHKIEVILDSKVTQIGSNWIEINGREIVPSWSLVYVPGIVANPVISTVNAEKDGIGRAIVSDYIELTGFTSVYAIGDCAHFQDPVTGHVTRPRAHNAVRQAKIAAKNLTADLKLKKRGKYHYSDSAEIISLGRSNALLRVYKCWFHGIFAVLIWVMSYSLLAIGKKNRIKIAIDWILSRIYGPDTTVIKQKRTDSQFHDHSDLPTVSETGKDYRYPNE